MKVGKDEENKKCVVLCMARGSSVECRTRNRESPCSNHPRYHFEVWAFSLYPRCPSSLCCMNECLAIDGGENMSE